MTLRTKTITIIGLTVVALFGVLLAASQLVLMSGFVRLEQQSMQRDVDRALAALTAEEAGMASTIADWANWDDTYQFVSDVNPAYKTANVTDEALDNLHLNLVLFFDGAGRLIYGRAYDLFNHAEVPIPAGVDVALADAGLLLHHADLNSHVEGIAILPEGAVFLAAHPILTSQREGPIRGTLVMGRNLDAQVIDGLSQNLLLPISLHNLKEASLPADVRDALSSVSSTQPIVVRALSQERVAGYSIVRDVKGQPALMLRIELPRAIYQQGRASINYFGLYLLLVCLAVTGVALWLLDKQILCRVSGLSRGVESIGLGQDMSARLAVSGQDELSGLAVSINSMLEQLEESESTLRASESRLQERTAELDHSNEQLRSDVAARVRVEEELRQEKDFAESLVETAQAIILVLDTEGRIVSFNPYLETISGYCLEEVRGKDWIDTFLPERDRAAAEASAGAGLERRAYPRLREPRS